MGENFIDFFFRPKNSLEESYFFDKINHFDKNQIYNIQSTKKCKIWYDFLEQFVGALFFG